MGEGEYGIEGGETREGSCLVRVEQSNMPGKEGETGSDDSLQYLERSFK